MDPNNKQQPGQTVAPSGALSGTPPPTVQPAPPAAPSSKSESATPAPPVDTSTRGGGKSASSDPNSITWTASEFIAHAKSFGWYAALAAGAVVFAGLVFLISRDYVSVSVVIVAALLLGVFAGRQPRQLEYRLDTGGVGIGQKRFGYDEFRSFSVIPEGAFSSIVFMPLKRFAVPTTIYYAPQDEDRIVQLLSDRLPMEKSGHDAVDRLMHRIRF